MHLLSPTGKAPSGRLLGATQTENDGWERALMRRCEMCHDILLLVVSHDVLGWFSFVARSLLSDRRYYAPEGREPSQLALV